ncbi:hypothetical protein LTR94_037086, partial [Friedmanniomyces endolithicus]
RPDPADHRRQLGRGGAGHADGGDDDRLLLHDHRLYPDLRQQGVVAQPRRKPVRHRLCRHHQLRAAAGDGRAVGSGRASAAADHRDGAGR